MNVVSLFQNLTCCTHPFGDDVGDNSACLIRQTEINDMGIIALGYQVGVT